MIYSYVSSRTIIGKIFRDLKIQDAHWINDAVEWMGEALQAIGSPVQTVSATKIAKTTSHKTPLPNYLCILEEVRYGVNNTNKPLDTPPKYEDFTSVMAYSGAGIHTALIKSYNRRKGVQPNTAETFFINGNMISTSFEEDWVALVYKALALDEQGYPLVPDHFSFSQALYWYIVMKMLEGGMEHPAGRQQINWAVAEDRWLKYCGQARSKANMPDLSKYKEFAKTWVQLIPDYSEMDLRTLEGEYEQPKDFKSVAYSPIKED